jgi:signal transduction histidine kinase
VDELIRTTQDPDIHESLLIIRRNAARLLRLIDDLLDLARMEAGTLRLRVRSMDFSDLAKKVSDNIRPAANAKSIAVSFESHPEKIEIHGDEHRLEIVLTNLLSNALKFTPRNGHISTRVELKDDVATVMVSDSGPGIPIEVQDRIFERFYQVQSSERRRYGGAGLGLALAREIAELHGGSLKVNSVPGQGATFTLGLPLGRDHFRPEVIDRRQRQLSEHPKRRAEDQAVDLTPLKTASIGTAIAPFARQDFNEPIVFDRGRRPRIVVVEDEDDLRQFIVNVLTPQFEVNAAADGARALALIKDQRPDLVLSDIMMPDMSGYDLCRAVKADPQLRRVIMILLTARGENETALEGFAAGADDFVPKPFHTQILVARIRAHLQNQALNLQLADHARLSTAGTLAAGLAHEIRNPINAVVNAAKVLKSGGSSKVTPEKLIEIITEGLNRINSVVSSLDTHARPADGMEAMSCNVEEGIEATLVLLSHRLTNVTIHKEFQKTNWVQAPARAFNQVLLNLIDNSLRSGANELWLRISEDRGFVKVSVEDNGPGIPSHITERIFDPFFTTRPTGTGTGLGLHLSRKLARDAGGDLYYEPRPGGGARFTMQVPSMEKAA